MDGNHAILEQLIADGFDVMFGLPGTEEEGFLDAIGDYQGRLRYVLCYQESVAAMAADGYARATRRPALVQIHSTPGLANALGAIWEAKKGNVPLVVLGGKTGVKYLPMEAHMSGDVVGLARPATKWAAMVTHPASTLRMLRRAIRIACTPPRGPVYLCLPMDVLDAESEEDVRPSIIPSTRVAPEPAWVQQAAEMLAEAREPRIFIGDGVVASGAEQALRAVAELLGAPVWSVHQGDMALDGDDPLFRGFTGRMFGTDSTPRFREGDVNLLCGTYAVPEVFPELGPVFAEGSRVIHIDLDPENIGKNHPFDLGAVADPKLTLESLAEALTARLAGQDRSAAERRIRDLAQEKARRRQEAIDRDAAHPGDGLMPFAAFARELAAQLPESALVFDESLTCSPALTRHLTPRAGRYFIPRGGCLGIGLPGAIGASAGVTDRMVVGLTGDGGAMEVIQCLATAARERLPAKLIVCNNRSYKVCEFNLDAYRRDRGIDPNRPQPDSFDLSRPDLNFAMMAEGQGVKAARVENPEDIAPRIREMIEHPGPFLLDVVAG
jgi:benzoylformate decarboxylase